MADSENNAPEKQLFFQGVGILAAAKRLLNIVDFSFRNLDTDKNGRLDKAEIETMQGMEAIRDNAPAIGYDRNAFTAALAADFRSKVSLPESMDLAASYKDAETTIKSYEDKQKIGLQPEETATLERTKAANVAMKKADANQDGKFTLVEAIHYIESAPPPFGNKPAAKLSK